MHPPASFVLLWPLFGWGSEAVARVWYALVTGLVVGLFARLLLREAEPRSGFDRGLLAALIVASSPAAITVGNGQITFHVLLAALAGVLVQCRARPGMARDLGLAVLFLIALVKPNLTLPLFWVIAFTRGWSRPAALAVAGYLVATAAAIALHGAGFQNVRILLLSWLAKGELGAVLTGYGNLHVWLGDLGLADWAFPASGLAFALHGLWAWRHRTAELWTRIGVAAIVARVWAYHRAYDDLLLLLPLVALYRLTRRESSRAAEGLFLLGAVALAAPATPILRGASWSLVTVWFLQLGYLARRAAVECRASLSAA
jgi:hypothetical protein